MSDQNGTQVAEASLESAKRKRDAWRAAEAAAASAKRAALGIAPVAPRAKRVAWDIARVAQRYTHEKNGGSKEPQERAGVTDGAPPPVKPEAAAMTLPDMTEERGRYGAPVRFEREEHTWSAKHRPGSYEPKGAASVAAKPRLEPIRRRK